jgi:hypothetical protein
MARLLRSHDTTPLADHHMIDLLDDAGELPWPEVGPDAPWFQTAPNAAFLTTRASGERLPLRVEVWDGKPPAAAGETASGRLTLTSGTISVNFLVDAEDAVAVEVGPPGTYHARAYAVGRTDESQDESYLVQFWPA